MKNQDIRWLQRFSNYKKALRKLEDSVDYVTNHITKESLDTGEEFGLIQIDLIKQGLIQSFEFTHELAWNVIKDYVHYQGNQSVRGSRDATREGFSMGLIEDGDVWMEMIRSRNQTSHTYDEETADEIFNKIINDYLDAFVSFKEKMEEILNEESDKRFE